MKPQKIMDSIVNAVKSKKELSGVTCVYSDSRDVSENPVCGFTLCIGTGKVKIKSSAEGFESVKTELCLLAPVGAGGKRLSEVAMWIAEAVKECINGVEVEISEPRYNEVTSVLFADIAVWAEHEASITDVCVCYIGDEPVEGITEVSAESSELVEKVPVLLSGYRFEKAFRLFYTLNLTADNSLAMSDVSVIKLCFKDYSEVYSGCVLSKAKKVIDKSNVVRYKYTFLADSKKVVERGA